MSKKITFLASEVSSAAGHFRDRDLQILTQVTAVLPSDHIESGLIGEFTIPEILDQYHKDEFLAHIGAKYIREWLEENT
ncbi:MULTISPECIES: hypothetical protein [Pseudomonas]|uniref:hypothetical protein n=1 Tax=Pseudomonas TaxID=286 RepID=UPI002361E767|nr:MULTISPECIES: hypothetical protein [Pseudomonas]WJV25880.1 hypothetical protein PSR66_07590 [Pseudomonas chlororaphis]